MLHTFALLAAGDLGNILRVGGGVVGAILALVFVAFAFKYGALWFQAYMSGADVSVMSLIGMSFRQVKSNMIVTAKIMGAQAGLNIQRRTGMSTSRLEAHYLAGGNVTNVSNQGNVVVDIRVNGTDYSCSAMGTIPVNHTRYSTTDGDYASMTSNLTFDMKAESGFDLGIEGIVTADNVNATRNEYWTIVIPSTSVSGTCTNSIQITGTYGV